MKIKDFREELEIYLKDEIENMKKSKIAPAPVQDLSSLYSERTIDLSTPTADVVMMDGDYSHEKPHSPYKVNKNAFEIN